MSKLWKIVKKLWEKRNNVNDPQQQTIEIKSGLEAEVTGDKPAALIEYMKVLKSPGR